MAITQRIHETCMLTNTLNTNEVRNAAGTEVEFQSISTNGREHIFAAISEAPSLPHRLSIKHAESGVGIRRRRRSVARVDKTTVSTVDSVTPVTSSAYTVSDSPVGALTADTEMKNVLAELGSFVHTSGTSTHLYDGTGTGAAVLISGGI